MINLDARRLLGFRLTAANTGCKLGFKNGGKAGRKLDLKALGPKLGRKIDTK